MRATEIPIKTGKKGAIVAAIAGVKIAIALVEQQTVKLVAAEVTAETDESDEFSFAILSFDCFCVDRTQNGGKTKIVA